MAQTAVDWLEEQLKKQGFLYDLDIEAAKIMEREQIIKAHDDGDVWSGEKYYTKTYGNNQTK